MIKSLAYVSQIMPYVPGKPISELERELGISGSVKLASNENPLGASPKAIKALKSLLKDPQEVGRYPDGGGFYLRNALAKHLNAKEQVCSIDNIILGNGSNELIDIAVKTYMGYGDEAVMATPSFVVYKMAVTAVGAKPIEIPCVDYKHNLQAMADAITDKTKIVFVANPNNPTGTMNTKDEFDTFMQRVPDGVLVIVDEAYYEYVLEPDYPDTMQYFRAGKDILILRTFSKAYGLAGLRIGYGIAKKEILDELNRIREPFNTNTLSQTAALFALTDKKHLKKTIQINEEGKKFLYSALAQLDVKYVQTHANFIYIVLNIDAKAVYEKLLHKGVIVRPVGPKELRVTIGLPEENQRFVESFKLVLNELRR